MKDLGSRILMIIAFAVAALPVAAQCELPIEKAPKLRGAHLGMSKADVIARFGKPTSEYGKFLGYLSFGVPVLDYENATVIAGEKLPNVKARVPENFDGITQLSVGLDDGKVTDIMIHYSLDAVEWDSNDEFAAALSEKLGLPKQWKVTRSTAELRCKGWTLTAEARTNRVFLIDNAVLIKGIQAERQEAAEKKKAFKP